MKTSRAVLLRLLLGVSCLRRASLPCSHSPAQLPSLTEDLLPAPPTASPLARLGRRIFRTETGYLALLFTLVGMLWAGITVQLDQERDQAGRQAALQSTDLAYGFEQGVVRIFESVDQTLLSARDEYARNPQHPDRLLPGYDCGDHLHPSPAGYKAMAEAIPLSLFAR